MSATPFTSARVIDLLDAVGIRKGGTPDFGLVQTLQPGVGMPEGQNNSGHRALVVFPAPAAGPLLNGLGESVGFQLRIRWRPKDYDGAERAAWTVHRALTRAEFPVLVTDPDTGPGVWVLLVTGNRPQLLDAADPSERVTFVSTYQAHVIEDE